MTNLEKVIEGHYPCDHHAAQNCQCETTRKNLARQITNEVKMACLRITTGEQANKIIRYLNTGI